MAGMPDMRRRSPEPPAGAAARSSSSPAWRTSCCTSSRRCWPRKASTSITSTCPTWTPCSRRSNRAIERHNMAMFTPVGHARELAAVTMRLAAEAIADGDTTLAAGILDQAQPESPDDSAATVAGCIGLALGLLDQWLSGHDTSAPDGLGQADPAARRALDRRTRRNRHPHPGPQGTRLRLPRLPDRPARRPARPLRQRPRPRRRPPGLGRPHRHTAQRHSPHSSPLRPIPSPASVAALRRSLESAEPTVTDGAPRRATPGRHSRSSGAHRPRSPTPRNGKIVTGGQERTGLWSRLSQSGAEVTSGRSNRGSTLSVCRLKLTDSCRLRCRGAPTSSDRHT